MRVDVIGRTEFAAPDDIEWTTDADGGAALAEFAGRACYESWDKPNPATATNATFLRHLLEVGHLSVLEHSTVTLYLRDVSRSLTHELVRHRHFSFSQLSQRTGPSGVVEPPTIAADPQLHAQFVAATEASLAAYRILLDGLAASLAGTATLRGKQARQAARSVLPNSAQTAIVVTGNYRAWRHFLGMRASEHADAEMREVAIACLHALRGVAPQVFADFEVTTLPDGTAVASSPYVSEG